MSTSRQLNGFLNRRKILKKGSEESFFSILQLFKGYMYKI